MSTEKTTSKKGPSHNIIERLKMFMDAFIKQLKKTPVKETKPKVKPAPKKRAVKSKTTVTRKTKPKSNTGV